jgi:hypothetical protein
VECGGEEHIECGGKEHVEHGGERVHDTYPDDGSTAACGRTASVHASTRSSVSALGFVMLSSAVAVVEACSITTVRRSRR